MKNLDERIEKKKEALNKAVYTKGVMDKHTLRLSRELDKLLVRHMRRGLSG